MSRSSHNDVSFNVVAKPVAPGICCQVALEYFQRKATPGLATVDPLNLAQGEMPPNGKCRKPCTRYLTSTAQRIIGKQKETVDSPGLERAGGEEGGTRGEQEVNGPKGEEKGQNLRLQELIASWDAKN